MALRKSILMLIIALMLAMSPGLMPFDNYLALAESDKPMNPVVDYAYIENGYLKFSVSDDRGLSLIPMSYRINKEYRTYEIDSRYYENLYDGNKWVGRVYEIPVEIPSTIYLMLKDVTGDVITFDFQVKEDNVPLAGSLPESVLNRLSFYRQSIVTRFEGFDRIYELQYGKIVNGLSLYDEILRNNYHSYNKNDIRIRVSGLSVDKDKNIKLDKYGIFKVTISHNKDKTFEESAYILLRPNWRDIEKREVPINASPYIVYNNRIRLADYFRYEDDTAKTKSKIDTSYMLAYHDETNQIYEMNQRIDLELNKLYKFTILNFENNSQEDFYIMNQERVRSANRAFLDVNSDFWAIKDINSLVSRGLLSGYPDGSFNPTGNISIREFNSILSRYIAIYPKEGQAIVNNVVLPISTSEWGYIESKSILDRIPAKSLSKFNYINLDRFISREEVALLLVNGLELGTEYSNLNRPLTDVATSSYPLEVRKLVDLGLISGYPDGTFRPKNNITRAEIAAIFARINK